MSQRLSGVLLAALTVLEIGCAHVHGVKGLGEELQQVPGGYVSGEVAGLERKALLDNKDFIYTIGLSPDGTRAAFTHLPGKTFNLGIWDLTGPEPTKVADVATNDYQYDVEGLDFSPDGQVIATAGRDGAVRFFAAADGKALNAFYADEPLVSVAFLPDGRHVVAGSAHGLLVLLAWPELAYVSELRAHTDEVRALAVTPGGHVVSGGWDKTIAELELVQAPAQVDELHLAVGETPQHTPVVRAGLDGHAGLFAFDAASPWVIVSSELAKEAGIQEGLLTEIVTVNGQGARVAKGRTVNLKQVALTGVDVAVCTACLPPGADGMIGAPVLGQYELHSNPATHELVLVSKVKHDPAALPVTTQLQRVGQHAFDSYVNDLSIDRAGKRLGVAFSAEKAERNREIYEREKKGLPAPFSEGDLGAIVELATGKLLHTWHHHLGIVSTAGISPDGRTLVSGGWDKKVYVYSEDDDRPRAEEEFGWSLRRIRFSRDGLLLGIAAWTPQNAVGSQQSDPSAVVETVVYSSATVVR